MDEHNNFRPLPSINLRRLFFSLGFPGSAFRSQSGNIRKSFFDCALNADDGRPNGLWLFKGANYFLYNLETGKIDDGQPIQGNFAGNSLPRLFRTGIHAAVRGGPAYPDSWYLFKDEMYVRVDSNVPVSGPGAHLVREKFWRVDEGPRGVLGVFATGVWTNPDGTWKTPGAPVALHGLGSKFYAQLHFFKDGQYVRHDLNTGGISAGPMPISDAWNLPPEFAGRIDLAFYGAGQNEENIYFISGEKYVLYDFRLDAVLDAGLVEKRFPAFAQFFGRPQLFLAEDYTLETFVGPTHLGRLIDTRNIGAGATIKKILVTETRDTSKSTLTTSLLQSQESSIVSDFYSKLDKNTSSSEGGEGYKYQLNANAHGDASADSLWGGEVNASLDVRGQTDTLRSNFTQAAFESIQSQVNDSKRQTEQKTYNSQNEIESEVKVLRQDIFEETNSTDKVRRYEFYEQLQSYVTLLVLRQVRIAYSDGTDSPKVVELRALPGLLEEVLAGDKDQVQRQLTGYLKNELSNISDYEGKPRPLLRMDGASADLVLENNITSTYRFQRPDGTEQLVSVRGIIKADQPWVEPTYTITCVQT